MTIVKEISSSIRAIGIMYVFMYICLESSIDFIITRLHLFMIIRL